MRVFRIQDEREKKIDNQQVSSNISKDHYFIPSGSLPSAQLTSRDQRRKTGNQDNLKRNSTRGGSRVYPFTKPS
jgi:hypothetical protein